MSTYVRSSENDTGRTDPRPHYIPVGTDGEGAHHCYNTRREEIVVVRDGRREHAQALDGRPVEDWIEYVADRRGWETQYLFQSAGAAWAAALDPLREVAHGD